MIPESVTRIGDNAFLSCESLTEIDLPGGVTTIGRNAFQNCISLQRITIPAGVTAIANKDVFSGCRELTLFVVPGSYAEQYGRDNRLRISEQDSK